MAQEKHLIYFETMTEEQMKVYDAKAKWLRAFYAHRPIAQLQKDDIRQITKKAQVAKCTFCESKKVTMSVVMNDIKIWTCDQRLCLGLWKITTKHHAPKREHDNSEESEPKRKKAKSQSS